MARNSVVEVQVKGLREFLDLLAESETELVTEFALAMLDIGKKIQADVRKRYSQYSIPGSAGVQTKLSGGQVWTGRVMVVQTLRKSTSLRSRSEPITAPGKSFGGMMMRKAFLPGLRANEAYAAAETEAILRRIEEKWA